jgi:hypothetical protein
VRLKQIRKPHVVLLVRSRVQGCGENDPIDLPNMAPVAIEQRPPNCSARSSRQRLANVSLSTDQIVLRISSCRFWHHLACSGVVSVRFPFHLCPDALVCVQRHVTGRTARPIHSILSPPERQRNRYQLATQLHEKSVSLAAVAHPNQLARSPQTNLAGCLDHSSRTGRTTPASQHARIFSFVRCVTREMMLQILQVTAAEPSWEHLCLAAFSCLACQLSDAFGRSARSDLIRDLC